MIKEEIDRMVETPRKCTVSTVLETVSSDVETLNATSLSSIAINLAELTDKVCELTAYMMGFCEWAREQKQK